MPIQGQLSLALLLALFAGMTAWGLRAIEPGYPGLWYGVAGLGCAVLFVVTVFVHEVAHVVAARLFGARVQGVTLSFLGGETSISGQPGSPAQGVVVAIAGPAASVVCGAGCLGVAFAMAALAAPVLLSLALAWVGMLCLVLAAANLIPAAPLDGGHLLQALVWKRTGDRVRASAVAGLAGQVAGAGLLACAGYLAVHGSLLTGLALVLFAVPLWRGGTATRRAAQQRHRLAGSTVADTMHRRFATFGTETPAAVAAAGLSDADYAVVVTATGTPRALLDAATIRATARRRPLRQLGHVRRWRPGPVTARAEEPLADALERSRARLVPMLVVSDAGVIGVLRPVDLAARLATPARTARRAAVPADMWPGRTRTAH